MSENLDLVRSIYAAWECGDFSSAEWADREIDATWIDGPSPGTWTGPAGMAQGMRDVVNVWDGFCVEAEEFRELDDDRVVVSHRTNARGKASGADLSARGAAVFQVRDRRVRSLVIYWNRDRALADLGLAPEESPPDS